MKRLLFAVLTAFALIGIDSCIGGSGYNDPFSNNPGNSHHRGDNNSGDNGGGNSGGNGGSQGSTSIFPGDQTYKLMADAVYYGDQNYPDVDQFTLFLYWGEYDDNDDFKTVGTELAFDLLCPKTGRMELSSGKYSCATEDFTPFHFLDGFEENGEVFPSYAYYKSTDGSKIATITSGTMDISSYNGKCDISVVFKTQAPNSQKETVYKVNFSGEVAYFDARSQEGDVPKDVEMKTFSRVTAEYWGQIWEYDDKKTIPVDDWVLYLYGENAEKDSEYTTIEILTEPGSKKLAPGIYNDFAQMGHPERFRPGAVVAGYTEGDDYTAYGTWYCKGGTAYYAATKGQLAVAVKDDLYSLSFDFTDEDEQTGGSFKGSYTGKIDMIDMTVQTKSGTHRGNVMKHIVKTAHRRNLKAARKIPAE